MEKIINGKSAEETGCSFKDKTGGDSNVLSKVIFKKLKDNFLTYAGMVGNEDPFLPIIRMFHMLDVEREKLDVPGGIKTLLRTLITNFPTTPGEKHPDFAWTTDALRQIDSSLPLPSSLSQKEELASPKWGIPTLLFKIAAILGTDTDADSREKHIIDIVKKTANHYGPGTDAKYFSMFFDAAANFSALAFFEHQKTNLTEYETARIIIASATACLGLVCRELWNGVPKIITKYATNLTPFHDSMTAREAISRIQLSIDDTRSPTYMNLELLNILMSGLPKSGELEQCYYILDNDFGIVEVMSLGLSISYDETIKFIESPRKKLKIIHENGRREKELTNKSYFKELSFLPSPKEALEGIRNHSHCSLKRGVIEVPCNKGAVLRVRLMPLSTGHVRAVIETQTNRGIVLSVREIPRIDDDNEWKCVIRNDKYTRLVGGYTDPICAAIEALRVSVVDEERIAGYDENKLFSGYTFMFSEPILVSSSQE